MTPWAHRIPAKGCWVYPPLYGRQFINRGVEMSGGGVLIYSGIYITCAHASKRALNARARCEHETAAGDHCESKASARLLTSSVSTAERSILV